MDIESMTIMMNRIKEQVKEDSKIDRTELGDESLRTPIIHSKYLQLLSEAKIENRKLYRAFETMKRLKWEWYSGTMSEERLKGLGWKPFQQKLVRSDIEMCVDSDPEVQETRELIERSDTLVDYLTEICKMMSQRTWQIKNAIEWTKFTQGIG